MKQEKQMKKEEEVKEDGKRKAKEEKSRHSGESTNMDPSRQGKCNILLFNNTTTNFK